MRWHEVARRRGVFWVHSGKFYHQALLPTPIQEPCQPHPLTRGEMETLASVMKEWV